MPKRGKEISNQEMKQFIGCLSALGCVLCAAAFCFEVSTNPVGQHMILEWMGTMAFGMGSEVAFRELRTEKLDFKYMTSRIVLGTSLLFGISYAIVNFVK